MSSCTGSTRGRDSAVLVGAVIEKVTGKPWYVNVAERIAKPLGLTTIQYGTVETRTPHMARGYTYKDCKIVPSQIINMSVPHAAGARIGSVEDLAKWNAALRHGKVIPAELYARMNKPTKLPDGSTSDYGFGMGMRAVRGRPASGHGGGIFGFSTDSIYLPKEDLFVAVFTNSDSPATDPGMVMQQLAALAINDPFPTFEKVALDTKAVDQVGSRAIGVGDDELRRRNRAALVTEVSPMLNGAALPANAVPIKPGDTVTIVGHTIAVV